MCNYKKEIEVELIDTESFFEKFLPNAFSPNGDMVNDVQKISAPKLSIVEEVLQLDIFDRYGSILFSKETYDSGDSKEISWNGLISGQLAEPNTYLAKAVLLLSDGTIKSVNWSVLLIH